MLPPPSPIKCDQSKTKISPQSAWYPTIDLSVSDTDEWSDDEICQETTLPTLTLDRSPNVSAHVDDMPIINPQVNDHNVDPDSTPLSNFNQSRKLQKKDMVTFFNDKKQSWIVATITSGPNKYYIKHGQYHNFQADDGTKGGHYFNPDGLWSLLSDTAALSTSPGDKQQISDHELDIQLEESSLYIDDDYSDQMDLSPGADEDNSDFADVEHIMLYPSVASFPDLDLTVPVPLSPRTRFASTSEPELPTHGCHRSLQDRVRRWGSALRDAWSSSDHLEDRDSSNQTGDGEEERGQRHPY